MDFSTWFQRWLTRHPLKEPMQANRASYTADVMAKIKTVAPAPARSFQPRRTWATLLNWPRPALALAATLGFVLVLMTVQRAVHQRQLAENAALRSRMLAEETGSDAEWIAQTLDVLEQFDEDDVPVINEDQETGDSLNELDLLEEPGSSAS